MSTKCGNPIIDLLNSKSGFVLGYGLRILPDRDEPLDMRNTATTLKRETMLLAED